MSSTCEEQYEEGTDVMWDCLVFLIGTVFVLLIVVVVSLLISIKAPITVVAGVITLLILVLIAFAIKWVAEG